jgi:hypothetical protein
VLYGLMAWITHSLWIEIGFLFGVFTFQHRKFGEWSIDLLLALLIWAMVSFLIVRWSWRAAKKPVDAA